MTTKMEVLKTITSVFKPRDFLPTSTLHETEVSSILSKRLTQNLFHLLSVLFIFVSQAAPVEGEPMLGEMLELFHPQNGWQVWSRLHPARPRHLLGGSPAELF